MTLKARLDMSLRCTTKKALLQCPLRQRDTYYKLAVVILFFGKHLRCLLKIFSQQRDPHAHLSATARSSIDTAMRCSFGCWLTAIAVLVLTNYRRLVSSSGDASRQLGLWARSVANRPSVGTSVSRVSAARPRRFIRPCNSSGQFSSFFWFLYF